MPQTPFQPAAPRRLTLSLALALALGSAVNLSATSDGPPDKPEGAEKPRLEEPPPPGQKPRDERRRRMSPENVLSAIETVRVLYPELAEPLESLNRDDPEEARKTLERRFPRVRFLVSLKQRDPEMYDLRVRDIQLERQSLQLAERLLHAEPPAEPSDQERAKLRGMLAEHFDIRQQIRTREIAAMQDRLEDMRKQLDEQATQREALIDKRLKEVLTPPPAPPADKPAEKPEAKAPEKPAEKPDAKKPEKPVEEPTTKSPDQPADKPAEKPDAKKPEKPASKPVEPAKPADSPADKPAEASAAP